jgi:hypothetical protein
MKIILALLLTILLTGCGSATPAPVTVTLGTEFTLAPNQRATLTDTNLTVSLIGVTGDERCPSEIECAASGPVSLSLSAQIGDSEPTDINLQVFTSHNGRAPDMQFEGIEDRAIFEGYLIRVVSVLPYPAKASEEIKASEYRVIFIVSKVE